MSLWFVGSPGRVVVPTAHWVAIPNPPPIHVRDIRIDRDSDDAVLLASFVGEADDYRIATDPDDFSAWSPLSDVVQTG